MLFCQELGFLVLIFGVVATVCLIAWSNSRSSSQRAAEIERQRLVDQKRLQPIADTYDRIDAKLDKGFARVESELDMLESELKGTIKILEGMKEILEELQARR